MFDKKYLYKLLEEALQEDLGEGDHTTLACLTGVQTARRGVLRAKEKCVLAGGEIAELFIKKYMPDAEVQVFKKDGEYIDEQEVILTAKGDPDKLLLIERTMLNIVQRMSGIATLTRLFVKQLEHTNIKLLDSRKTTPNFRLFEKEAFRIGGGISHRKGLYDAIMIKDNHISIVGDIQECLRRVKTYMEAKCLTIPVIIEAKNHEEIVQILESPFLPDRILLDNFFPSEIDKLYQFMNKRQVEIEISGGVNLDNIMSLTSYPIDYISTGYPVHHAHSKDFHFKVS